jgi:uncharacterized coiled-coil DUF342 family protein
MQERIETLEKKITVLSQDISEIKELIGSGFKKTDNNFDSIKKEMDGLTIKTESIKKSLELLRGSTDDGFGTVGLKLENLSDEISKIGIVTRYEEQFKHLKTLN